MIVIYAGFMWDRHIGRINDSGLMKDTL
jgi:hypothetical protein